MRFFSPPEKPSLTERCMQLLVHLDELHLLAREREEVDRVELGLAAVLAHRVERGLQEVALRDARDLDRVLEREEDALARALLGREREQVLAVEAHLARA